MGPGAASLELGGTWRRSMAMGIWKWVVGVVMACGVLLVGVTAANADFGDGEVSNKIVRGAVYSHGHRGVQLWAGGPFWAETNIGAEDPWDYGLYFWWGDTVGSSPGGFSVTWNNSPTADKEPDQLKSEGWLTAEGVLTPKHDAAYVQWGGGWRMPTDQELWDLRDKCDWTWTNSNGVNGCVVCGRGVFENTSIFLPAAGIVSKPPSSYDAIYVGEQGYYWSSCLDFSYHNDYSEHLVFKDSGYAVRGWSPRGNGISIRPVQNAVVPVLRVERADPAAGSLTLGWEDEGGGEEVTYSVYRSANDTYSEADLVANGLTGTSWTDKNYWAAEPVLKPLNYWVVADGGGYGERVSEPVETRHRYGLCVGIGKYVLETDNPGMAKDANLCKELAEKEGDFSHVERIPDDDATLSTVQGHMKKMAALAQPGDVFLFFFSGHGEAGKLLLRGTWNYTTTLLREDIAAFNPGVAVIGIVMACHSGSILSLGNWPANAAWICSCGSAQESLIFRDGLGPTPFGNVFLQDGWKNGYADGALFGTKWTGGNGDGIVTFYELMRYANVFVKGYSDQVRPSDVQRSNTNLLARIAAGRVGAKNLSKRPEAPEACDASYQTSNDRIDVWWTCPTDSSISRYWLFRQGPGEKDATCISRYAKDGRFSDPGKEDKSLQAPAPKKFQEYRYFVQAVSPSGISEASPEAIGMSGTPELKEWLEDFGYITEAQIASADTAIAANGVNTVFDSYVLGLNPTDQNSRFETRLRFEDGKPIPTWVPDLNEGGIKAERVYRVEAKKEMSDGNWTDVTNVEDLEAEGWRFFRVGVELVE